MKAVDGPYRRYTAMEIEAANDTDLPDLLEHLGYQIQRVGRCYTTREMDSLRIWDRRTWYRYSESIGGDAIEFLRHFHGMSFSEAVKFLLEYSSRNPPRSLASAAVQAASPATVRPSAAI